MIAPLIRLTDYVDLLARVLSAQQIDDKVSSIRKQHVSNIFYLPRGASLDADHIAVLDDLHSLPLTTFEQGRAAKMVVKLFTLSQMGFYLFLVKLSIHFCRFQEGVAR